MNDRTAWKAARFFAALLSLIGAVHAHAQPTTGATPERTKPPVFELAQLQGKTPSASWPMVDGSVIVQRNSGSRDWEPDEFRTLLDRLGAYDGGAAYFDHEPRPDGKSPVWTALAAGTPMPMRYVREQAAAPTNPAIVGTFGWPSKWRESFPNGVESYHLVNDSMRPALALYDRLMPSVYLPDDLAADLPVIQMNRAFQITRNTILEAKRIARPGQDITPFVSFRYGGDGAWATNDAVLGMLAAISVEKITRVVYWENPGLPWNPPDYTPVLQRWYTMNGWRWPIEPPTAVMPRLWWFQTVGHSNNNEVDFGQVSRFVCNPDDGWSAYTPRAKRVRAAVGEDANVGWFGHNPFGTWQCCKQLMTETSYSSMLFEQWPLALLHAPALADAAALARVLDEFGFVWRCAYIGAPRSDEVDGEPYPIDPNANDPAHLADYYGFIEPGGFEIVVHDAATAVCESATSPTILVNEPWLEDRGVIPGTEAIPARDQPWTLRPGVVLSCAERRLHFTENHLEPWTKGDGTTHPGFYSIEECKAAGMIIAIDITHPWDELRQDLLADPGALQRWRYERAMFRAADPSIDMIVVPLNQMIDVGLDLRALYEACEAGRPTP